MKPFQDCGKTDGVWSALSIFGGFHSGDSPLSRIWQNVFAELIAKEEDGMQFETILNHIEKH